MKFDAKFLKKSSFQRYGNILVYRGERNRKRTEKEESCVKWKKETEKGRMVERKGCGAQKGETENAGRGIFGQCTRSGAGD